MLLTFAASLAVAGCQTKTAAIEGAGFSLLKPAAATRDFIIKNDRPFAEQVAGNNRTCQRARACAK
jgi:hypothetical protein